jgi:hypothetical protein
MRNVGPHKHRAATQFADVRSRLLGVGLRAVVVNGNVPARLRQIERNGAAQSFGRACDKNIARRHGHPTKPTSCFTSSTTGAAIARALAEASPEGAFTASLFKDRSGVGRNLSIEILEYLDRMGLTRRVGDARVVLREAGEVLG